MPLYEYECTACGHRFEQIQKFSDPLASSCPKCGGAVKKLMSMPAIQFKGTGWYVTDYARKGQGAGTGGNGSKPEKRAAASPETPTREKGSPTSDSSTSSSPSPAAAPGSTSSDS